MGSLATNYLFAGQQYDSATGLYSMRARYYDPGVGRFLSRDTWAINYANPVELNRYVYAANNPTNFSDPSGNFILIDYGNTSQRNRVITSGVAGGVGGAVGATVFHTLALFEVCGKPLRMWAESTDRNQFIGRAAAIGFGMGIASGSVGVMLSNAAVSSAIVSGLGTGAQLYGYFNTFSSIANSPSPLCSGLAAIASGVATEAANRIIEEMLGSQDNGGEIGGGGADGAIRVDVKRDEDTVWASAIVVESGLVIGNFRLETAYGALSMYIRVKDITVDPPLDVTGIGLTGREVFDLLWKAIDGDRNVRAIGAEWSDDPDVRTNYDIYRQNLADGMSTSNAALNTPTGSYARNKGYTEVRVNDFRSIVRASFWRPGTAP